MFVLGIGKSVDRAELNQIASGPNNTFTVDSFKDLKDKVHEIKGGICTGGIFCFFAFWRNLSYYWPCFDRLELRTH